AGADLPGGRASRPAGPAIAPLRAIPVSAGPCPRPSPGNVDAALWDARRRIAEHLIRAGDAAPNLQRHAAPRDAVDDPRRVGNPTVATLPRAGDQILGTGGATSGEAQTQAYR